MSLETNGQFYLGRHVDADTGRDLAQTFLYDPADLVTHGVVVGMTGSGKTGLCLGLLEEAALNRIPALMIDPKGDITNALLHFPELAPADFAPWINPDQARREGKSTGELAAETAAQWRAGLADWAITPDRIQALQERVQFAVYTPGSDAGLPISILASLKAPEIAWAENREMLREKIASTVTALLGLIGLKDVDPLRSREHILLSNIFEQAWSQGQDLDLGELILQTQEPPFDKLGVLPLDRFFPEKARFELAMLLNNILAAPSFQTWIEGMALDIPRLLYTEDGRPRHTIFYIAHLSEAERMFFVTLLFSAVESWMRTQSGATSLRALLYFDEIVGYLPPVSNPPSKTVMLRMLKQARAFGVGLLLATQNPVDVDYRALSNAGTWFIGKLATEQDKDRLLDGLASAAQGGLDRRTYDQMISALGKRVFLLRNVHNAYPLLFRTRWAMNYLAGPLTRMQIGALNALANPQPAPEETSVPELEETQVPEEADLPEAPAGTPPATMMATTVAPAGAAARQEAVLELGLETRPEVPNGLAAYIFPLTMTLAEAAPRPLAPLLPQAQAVGLLYRPVLFAQAHIAFYNRKYNLNLVRQWAVLVRDLPVSEVLPWEQFAAEVVDPRVVVAEPRPGARFAPLEGGLADGRVLRSLRTHFGEWLYRNSQLMVRQNETLGVAAGPDVAEADFRQMCASAAQARAAEESGKAMLPFERKLDTLRKQQAKAEDALSASEQRLADRRSDESMAQAKAVIGLFSKERRRAVQGKQRLTEKARVEVEKSRQALSKVQQEMAGVEQERRRALAEIQQRWAGEAARYEEVALTPFKKDVQMELFGVAWLPYHLVQLEGRIHQLAGWQAAS